MKFATDLQCHDADAFVPADQVGKLSVTRMATGSVAERAGMKEADVLLQVDAKPITSGPQLIEVLVSRNGPCR